MQNFPPVEWDYNPHSLAHVYAMTAFCAHQSETGSQKLDLGGSRCESGLFSHSQIPAR